GKGQTLHSAPAASRRTVSRFFRCIASAAATLLVSASCLLAASEPSLLALSLVALTTTALRRVSAEQTVSHRRMGPTLFKDLLNARRKLLRYTRSHAISGVSNDRYACPVDLPHLSDSCD